MNSDLEKRQVALLASASKYATKVSPLLIACGLIQEGLNLTQALAEQCQLLQKELDERKTTVGLDNSIRNNARGEKTAEDSGGAPGPGSPGS